MTTDFIDANLKLTVTPHVTNDGNIKMTIKVKKDAPDTSITVEGVPSIDKKEAITEVLIKDNGVVVIAGIYSIEKRIRRRVFLSSIKFPYWAGYLKEKIRRIKERICSFLSHPGSLKMRFDEIPFLNHSLAKAPWFFSEKRTRGLFYQKHQLIFEYGLFYFRIRYFLIP